MRRFTGGGLGTLVWALILLVCLVPRPGRADETGYLLGAGDKLRISVFERPELSGTFVVRPPGAVSLPSVGEIEVAGVTAATLERLVSERLGLKHDEDNHWVSVEILEFRPFFIVGSVRNPGSYPFVSGMTVLHAIALAGGYQAFETIADLSGEKLAATRERLRTLQVALGSSLLQQARLNAEYQESDEIDFPDEAAYFLDDAVLRTLEEKEVQILADRRASDEMQRKGLEFAKAAYDAEILAHNQHYGLESKQLELLAKELEALRTSAPGVVPKSYLLSLERVASGVEGSKRDLEAFIARARQARDRLEQDLLVMFQDRRVAVAEALREIEDKILTLRISIQESGQILGISSGADDPYARASGAVPVYDIAIVRTGPDGTTELAATELTRVVPGDVVRITSALPGS